MSNDLMYMTPQEKLQAAWDEEDARTAAMLEPPEDEATVTPQAAVAPAVWELDGFLQCPETEYDWLVPNLIERGDRLIITGAEGGGKSTLLRQLAVQFASGVHPFDTSITYPSLRVLLLDLENSERHVRRELRPLRLAAGKDYAGTLAIHVRPQGLDILQAEDVAWLGRLIACVKPDVVLTGPTYKMATGDPTEEKTARTVAAHLDYLRTAHQFALILEAHTPYASNGGKRPERPYGASLWSRWPEFGLYLDKDSGALRHWRGARDERDWPAVLQRGGSWPWTTVNRPVDLVWARILEHTMNHGQQSYRTLAKDLGVGQGTVQRAVDAHRAEWDLMA